MKYMKFYKLHDWILDEFGASTDAALISIIYSFEENDIECRLSYSQFAEILKVSRPNAIARIKKLIEGGYIAVKQYSTQTNTYFVNREVFNNDNSAGIENDTSYNIASNENDTSTSIENDTSTSNENNTSASIANDTQKENNKREKKKREEKERESARARDLSSPSFVAVPEYPDIRLTKDELDKLEHGFKYGKDRDRESYLAALEDQLLSGKVYPNHFLKLKTWILKDGGKALTEQEMENNKEFERRFQSSVYIPESERRHRDMQ